jgi:hypothetical protein
MKIKTGKESIQYLSRSLNKKDLSSSIYWNEHHKNLKFDGIDFEGLSMLGNSKKRSFKNLVLNFFGNILAFRNIFKSLNFSNLFCFISIDLKARRISKVVNSVYDFDRLRHTLTLVYLNKTISQIGKGKNIAIIGDGFGTLTTLLGIVNPENTRILVNLNKSLLVDLIYIKRFYSQNFDDYVTLVTDLDSLNVALEQKKKIICITAEDSYLLKYVNLTMVFNIASMQEMNNHDIDKYFHLFRHSSECIFYCCNRKEKVLEDGTINRIYNYPWVIEDTLLMNEICPWHQYFPVITPPFYKKYDGLVIHILAKLKSIS